MPHQPRSPDFDSGVLEEPLVEFGGHHKHVDPKTGLALYGPYSVAAQQRPSLRSITVGIVGPAAMTADAGQWLEACRGLLVNDGSQPFLYPQFPGLNEEHPFQCELVHGDTWRETLRADDLTKALAPVDFYDRVRAVVSLYVGAIEVLSQREPRPDVILCCIPQPMIDVCTVKTTKGGERKRVKLTRSERRVLQMVRAGQGFLFPQLTPTLGTEDEESGHHNLRRGIKAEAMRFGIPTQLVWPHTLSVRDASGGAGRRRVQDVATRAWNFTVALYHKAGGSPWRLAAIDPGVCFVGVSFYRELSESSAYLRTSMAQAFTAAGDGYVLRGNSFEWTDDRERSPHLDRKSAKTLLDAVIQLYQRQNRRSLPSRIVLHKTSRFWDDELAGFNDACHSVPRHDLVTIGGRGIQFYRTGDYPALRGSFVKFSDTNLLLYTTGYVPFLRTYPGARVPRPLEILEHYGDSPWSVLLQEILALTKLNWNTADFACSDPITLAFSQRVGHILAELPADVEPRPEYRFYM